KQTFDRVAASAGSTLLTLAAIGLVVPAIFHYVGESAVGRGALTLEREHALETSLSTEIAVILFIAYVLSLVFSLRTHRHLYAGAAEGEMHASTPASSIPRAV